MYYLLILSHLLVLLVSSAVVSRVNAASAAPVAVSSVVGLPSRPSPQRLLSPSAKASVVPVAPDVEHDLLPFVLVSTVDGALHAIDREGGKVRWTLREGVSPLVGGGIRGTVMGDKYIVEPLTGDLYLFEEADEHDDPDAGPKVRKLPMSVEQLIELSPFTFPHSPSRIFTGSKHTSLLSIDLRTGQQLDCFSTLFANHSNAEKDCQAHDEGLLEDLDYMEKSSRHQRDILFVGKTEYRLTIHSPSGASIVPTSSAVSLQERSRSGAQEVTYSTYTPNSYDRPLAEYWANHGVASQQFEEETGKRMRIEIGHDGIAYGVELGGGVKWKRELGSAAIGVYDILLPLEPETANPILVPQPPPHLPSLFPLPPEPHPAHLDVLSRKPSAYIGAVPAALPQLTEGEDGETALMPTGPHRQAPQSVKGQKSLLYALSSTSYPLINFAPPPRPGTFTNGTFALSEEIPDRDQLLPYLIDPPEEDDIELIDAVEVPTIDHDHSTWTFAAIWLRGWAWYTLGLISALVLVAAGFVGFQLRRYHERTRPTTRPAGRSGQIPDDRVSLISLPELDDSTEKEPRRSSEKEKQVTFVIGSDSGGSATASGSTDRGNSDEVAPKKKNGRRRVRGKKKKGSAGEKGDNEKDDDEDGDEFDEKSGLLGDDGAPTGSFRKEKPLPELPREITTVDLKDEDKERLVITDNIIGYGSHGTVVLKGTWGVRPVAVKRLLSDFTRLASQEVKLLQASDDHPNVIRYYCQERRDNFLYIALDLCQASLADLIESPDKHMELASALDRKKALVQVTAGLRHLHGMKIIHRDIKPQNVLVTRAKDNSIRVMVSDFGLARRLEQDQSSFAPTANNLAGSLGWRAPECIRGQVRLNEGFDRVSESSSSSSTSLLDLADEDHHKSSSESEKEHSRLTKAVDLFALGCLYFWVLMSGEHPFGETYNRESNIMKGDPVKMDMLDILGEEGWEARELITRLLAMKPTDRPDTAECLQHPFFWSASKRLSFLCDASDRFEIMETEPPETTLVLLEANAVNVVGKDWFSKADRMFTSNLGKYRKYKGNSVRDLLRAMRNKKHHYQDLEPAMKRHLGALPTGFLTYFTSRYPTLFLHVWKVVRESMLLKEQMFDQYFKEDH